jgi:hypothetical protein
MVLKKFEVIEKRGQAQGQARLPDLRMFLPGQIVTNFLSRFVTGTFAGREGGVAPGLAPALRSLFVTDGPLDRITRLVIGNGAERVDAGGLHPDISRGK